MSNNGPDPALRLDVSFGEGKVLPFIVTFSGYDFSIKLQAGVHSMNWSPGNPLGMGQLSTDMDDLDVNIREVLRKALQDAYDTGKLGPKEFHTSDWNEVFAFCQKPDPIPGFYIWDVSGFTMFDVVDVIAMSEGEHDGPNWLAAVKLRNGRFAFISAGCDYTGWD